MSQLENLAIPSILIMKKLISLGNEAKQKFKKNSTKNAWASKQNSKGKSNDDANLMVMG
jgi:hypothetical protein